MSLVVHIFQKDIRFFLSKTECCLIQYSVCMSSWDTGHTVQFSSDRFIWRTSSTTRRYGGPHQTVARPADGLRYSPLVRDGENRRPTDAETRQDRTQKLRSSLIFLLS